MTNNTEPLKVGDACREAFEQWMQETYGYVPEPNTVYREGTYLSKRDDDRWIAYQAGRIQSTEPSPAEVSSENFDAENPRCKDGGIACDDCLCLGNCLSPQSPARVEGEREAFEKYATSGGLDLSLLSDGESYASWKTHGAWSAWQARSALNQRLAVKEGEADFWKWLPRAYRDGDVGDAPKFTKYNMEVAFNAGGSIQPPKDDQQAKDAALSFQPIQVNIGVKNGEN